ncbi:MAG: efflux RND transporter periplasmic adaptor subunit [Cyclobacteriaceae bacterium]|nr:efflux RND transporter periplasmic adaptor subunit [Cyclobacteriaceae bacterium]
MNKRQVIIVLVGISIVVGSFALSKVLGGMKEPPKKKPPVEIKKYVKTSPVEYGDVNTWILAHGRVSTAQTLDMIAEVPGKMRKGAIPLKAGQKFRKGTLLYSIDNTEVRLNLNAQKSNFLRDIASILPDLKIDYADNFDNWASYFEEIDIEKSLPELPKHKSNKEKTFLATKNIFSSYYSIKSAEANLRKYQYYAPFNGSITVVNFQSGSYVNPGAKIANLVQSNNMEIKVDVALKDINWVQNGAPVSITTDNKVDSWQGKVIRIGEVVNQQTQSIDVYVAIEQGDYPLYDGIYLQAKIPGLQVKQAMVIPRNAIFNGNEVFVLEDTLLKVKEINIHKLSPENAIFSGLNAGENLVVEPLINAHNNMKAFKLEEKSDFDIEAEEDPKSTLVNN